MHSFPLQSASRARRRFAILALALLAGAGALVAQVGGDRGIAPVATSTDIEVEGIRVNVVGDNPEDARVKGWMEAARLAWAQIDGPEIPDEQLDSLVSAIVVQREQLGPRRYIATLGVIFDRQRAGALLGGEGERARSAPMLTLPVLIQGGTATMFETRNPWQRAWAEYQAGASAIDYVRPTGAGGESLLLTYGQAGRRSRLWWNTILDQYSAADVIFPIADLRHEWPGGPVVGRFTARSGPDNRFLGGFTLRASGPAQLPAMMNQAVRRLNTIYTSALARGLLTPDPTLALGEFELTPEIQALIEASQRRDAAERARRAAAAAATAPDLAPPVSATTVAPDAQTIATFNVQVATPDAAAFDAALAGLRGAPGVRQVATSSLAVGGTSVLRVSFAGDLAGLAAALRAAGWQVNEGSNTLAISR
jgi:hypothetical protein